MAILHYEIGFTSLESGIHVLKKHRVPCKINVSNLQDRDSQEDGAPGKPMGHNSSYFT